MVELHENMKDISFPSEIYQTNRYDLMNEE